MLTLSALPVLAAEAGLLAINRTADVLQLTSGLKAEAAIVTVCIPQS